jgi:ribosomal protein S12 methylthiotransferase accessory factor
MRPEGDAVADPSRGEPVRDPSPVTIRPRLKRHLHAEVVGSDRVWLLSETGQHVLEGSVLAVLVPLIDGQRSIEEIADRLDGRVGASDVLYALWQLEDAGYVSLTPDDGRSDGAGAFADLLDVRAPDMAARLPERPVSVIEIGAPAVKPLLLERFGSLRLRVADGGAALTVVLVDDYLRSELAEWNREALAIRRPWLLAKPAGAVIWCGPLFNPGATACWACLARRLLERDRWSALRREGTRPRLSRAYLDSTVRLAVEMAATETWKWVVGAPDTLADRLVTLDTRAMTAESHTVVRQPTCPVCGQRRVGSAGPLRLQSQIKLPVSDGGYRCQPPDVTYERFKHHVSPVTGIIDRLEPRRAANLDLVQVFTAPYTFASPVAPENVSPAPTKLRSAGKGQTASQARTGALCEAAERYSAIYRGDELTIRARAVDLGDTWIAPNACMQFSDRQYAEREEWNRRSLRFHWIPVPFDPERPIDWTEAWSLTEGRRKYVPAAYCYYGYPMPPDLPFCQADSNGSAAGANLEEAILQGFMELVERDAVALWWYNRIQRPEVALESFGNPYFTALRDSYLALNRGLHVLDISSDFGVPVFAAISTVPGQENSVLLGFGAHFDPAIALSRAVTELSQLLPAVLAGRPRELFAEPLSDIEFLRGGRGPIRRQSDFPHTWTPDLLEDINRCVSLAGNRGLETIVVDLTRPDVGIPVVKVIAPGLRPFWARFAPGRLYDVPVAMGWMDVPLLEDQLNPAYILF